MAEERSIDLLKGILCLPSIAVFPRVILREEDANTLVVIQHGITVLCCKDGVQHHRDRCLLPQDIGVVLCPLIRQKQDKDTSILKEKRGRRVSRLPLPVRLPLNLDVLTSEFPLTADQIVLWPIELNHNQVVLLLGDLLGSEATREALSPTCRQGLACKFTLLEGGGWEYHLGKLLSRLLVSKRNYSGLGAVGLHEQTEADTREDGVVRIGL